MNVSASFTCSKCGAKFRAKFPQAKEKGCLDCGAVYEKLTHIPVVCCDQRETKSGVPGLLEDMGVEMQLYTLEVGDFVVSDRMGFERKTPEDLLQDWVDNHGLFTKLYDTKRAYRRAILLLEGSWGELYEQRMINPASVEAMTWTIAGMGVATVETLTATGTARALAWYAHREQREKHYTISLHGKRSHFSESQLKEYIISAIPDIGETLSKNLLTHFGSIEKIVTAPKEELMKVAKIGEKKAEYIRKVVSGGYK